MSTLIKHTAVLALVVAAAGCPGRSPSVGQPPEQIEEQPPPPPPEVRTLGTRRLFGDMPVENRFQDPLLTFSGTGWFAFSDSFNDYPLVHRVVDGNGPTSTPYVAVDPAENDNATVLGQLKTSRAPVHVEVWIGRDGAGRAAADFAGADLLLAGLFVGIGESAAQLTPVGDVVVAGARSWQKFAVDLDEGPIGWSYLMAGDPAQAEPFYLGGPVAIDLDAAAAPSSALAFNRTKRPLSAREARMIGEVQERTRTLSVPKVTRR